MNVALNIISIPARSDGYPLKFKVTSAHILWIWTPVTFNQSIFLDSTPEDEFSFGRCVSTVDFLLVINISIDGNVAILIFALRMYFGLVVLIVDFEGGELKMKDNDVLFLVLITVVAFPKGRIF